MATNDRRSRRPAVRWWAPLLLGSLILGASAAAQGEAARASAAPAEVAPPARDPLLPEPLDRLLRGVFVAPARYRHEFREDGDFNAARDDGDHRDLFKLNAGVDARPVDPLRMRLAVRQTWTVGRNRRPTTTIDRFGQDRLDVFEAFIEAGQLEGVPLSLAVGRQSLAFGDERLVGPLEFVQNANTWDAVRLRLALDGIKVDAWWGRHVLFEGADDRNANRPVDTVDFFGLYGSISLGDVLLEPFYLAKYDDNHALVGERGRRGHVLLRHSPGVRAKASLPLGFDLDASAVLQAGKVGADEILAGGLAGKVLWTAPDFIRPLWQLEVEYVWGSGDGDPKDGKRNGFDNFYPTNHKFYGELDVASWQNIHDLEVTARLLLAEVSVRERTSPAKGAPRPYIWERAPAAVLPDVLKVTFEGGYHHFWLASRTDAWFNAPLGVIRRDASGRSGRDLGDEVDLVLRAGPLGVGYAHFFPGPFVRRTTPAGGDASGGDLFYVELALVF